MKHMWSEEEIQALLEKQGGSGGSTLDAIVDSKGNKRFVEGEGTPGSSEDFTTRYCKWSLSGTHLMCVLSATLRANEILPAKTLATFTVPDYIGRKILPTWGNSIAILEPYIKDIEGGGGNLVVRVEYANNNITFVLVGLVSAVNTERYFRIQFDLLIDTD